GIDVRTATLVMTYHATNSTAALTSLIAWCSVGHCTAPFGSNNIRVQNILFSTTRLQSWR
ncbi:hypothetical protein A2U01_0114298, partial [Trifolium medium]|nr:hypothetical protein [Trifolium medium]